MENNLEIGRAETAGMPRDGQYFMHTAFGPMPIPPCAVAFALAAKRAKPRSRIFRKLVRYNRYVDIFATKRYQDGAQINETMAPTWGEFDLHDMRTSQK